MRKSEDAYICSDTDEICDVEDLATAMVRYENGAVLVLDTSYALNMKEDFYSIQLFGSKGGVRACPDFEMYTDDNGYMVNMTPAGIRIDESGLFVREIAHFVDCIQNGTPCISPAEDGLDILRILTAVYRSAETGHEVLL